MIFFVTGAYGLLGSHLVPLLKDRGHRVITPCKKDFNITTSDPYIHMAGGVFGEVSHVINLAAYTDVPKAEVEPDVAIKTNTALKWLLELPRGIKIYHLSTDYVYNGTHPYSKETDLLEPFNQYGRSKALGDTLLLSHSRPNINIIRTSFKPVKWPYPMAFEDMRTNADTVDIIAAKILEFILTFPPGGAFNIGTAPKTIYELAKRNNPHVEPGSIKKIPFLRPNVTMDLTKYHTYMKDKVSK
jgi:dTDP-4-dehydrorhamnose reductase